MIFHTSQNTIVKVSPICTAQGRFPYGLTASFYRNKNNSNRWRFEWDMSVWSHRGKVYIFFIWTRRVKFFANSSKNGELQFSHWSVVLNASGKKGAAYSGIDSHECACRIDMKLLEHIHSPLLPSTSRGNLTLSCLPLRNVVASQPVLNTSIYDKQPKRLTGTTETTAMPSPHPISSVPPLWSPRQSVPPVGPRWPFPHQSPTRQPPGNDSRGTDCQPPSMMARAP